MIDISQISAQALAYLGDSVIEILVRKHLILKGFEKSGKLNAEARKFVTAVAQNQAFANIEGILTEQEADIFRRGKNSSHLNIPKSASPLEYKTATGFEAIFGFLHINGSSARIDELFGIAYKDIL